MLIWVFHCCNRSWPHRFIAVLATYELSLPLCLLTLCIQPIMCFVLLEIGFQFLGTDQLSSEEANSGAKMLELHPHPCPVILQWKCYLFVLSVLVFVIYRRQPKYTFHNFYWNFWFILNAYITIQRTMAFLQKSTGFF